MIRRRLSLAALAIAAATALAGCGTTPASDNTSPVPTVTEQEQPAELSGALTIFAAASLQDTFEQLGEIFEQENPSVTVTFNFGASSSLAQQIESGAPVDVLATANTTTMDSVADFTDDPHVFAQNSLEIVVPAGNPGNVTGLADFANADLTIALCAPDVPCGSAAEKAFAAAGITASVDTYEKDVTATLTKAVLGEVDAALVYRTDVISAGDTVEGISFPESAQALNDYPIATLTDAQNPDAAAAFVTLVRSEKGRSILTAAGFDQA